MWELTLKKYRRTLIANVKRLYCTYFGWAVGNQDKVWAPHYCCLDCNNKLSKWFAGKNVSLEFAVPMILGEQKDHITDCYFCLTKIEGYNQKNKKSIVYPNLASAICPVPHSVDLLVPIPPADLPVVSEKLDESSEDSGTNFDPCVNGRSPHFISQNDSNDLVLVLNLSKDKSELLASRLRQ